MIEVKIGKLSIIASYTCNFISQLFHGGKNMAAFCSTVWKLHWLFVLEVSTVTRFQNIICTANPEKENKILYTLPYEEMGAATIDFWQFKIRRGTRRLLG